MKLARLLVLGCILFVCLQTQAQNPPAQRIVALAPHIVETLFDIGAGAQVIAAVEYSDYPQAALDLPRVGGYHGVQLEKLLALKPDLIIVWKSGNKAADIAKMEQLKLPLAYSDAKSIDKLPEEIRYFGQLSGHQQQAEQVALEFERDLAQLRQAYSALPPIRTFYQLWSNPLMTVNKTTWIHQILQICGAENVFADSTTGYPQIGLENVLVSRPEVIIRPQEKSDKPQPKIDWQPWQAIPAVAKKQFVEIDADLVHRYSRRMLLGVEDMCGKLNQFR